MPRLAASATTRSPRLPDRTLIRDRLQQLLLRSQREHELIAAMLVDLDHFRAVNDRLGQRAVTSS